ncbi:MAG: hypothetical protein HQK49_09905 [Oligoflexia bacterium]|nr:hypothetical protein [Oligoflexia bacterium]
MKYLSMILFIVFIFISSISFSSFILYASSDIKSTINNGGINLKDFYLACLKAGKCISFEIAAYMMCGEQEVNNENQNDLDDIDDRYNSSRKDITKKEQELFNCLGDNFYASDDWEKNYVVKIRITNLIREYYSTRMTYFQQIKEETKQKHLNPVVYFELENLEDLLSRCRELRKNSSSGTTEIKSDKEFMNWLDKAYRPTKEERSLNDVYPVIEVMKNFNKKCYEKKHKFVDLKNIDLNSSLESNSKKEQISTTVASFNDFNDCNDNYISDLNEVEYENLSFDEKERITAKSELLRCLGDKFDISNNWKKNGYIVKIKIAEIIQLLYKNHLSRIEINDKLKECKKFRKKNSTRKYKINSHASYLKEIARLFKENSPAYKLVKAQMDGKVLCGNRVNVTASIALFFKIGIVISRQTCITPFGHQIYVNDSWKFDNGISFGAKVTKENIKESKYYSKLRNVPQNSNLKFSLPDEGNENPNSMFDGIDYALINGKSIKTKQNEQSKRDVFGLGFNVDLTKNIVNFGGTKIKKIKPASSFTDKFNGPKNLKIIRSIEALAIDSKSDKWKIDEK